jgi:hypothetical protein
MFAILSLVVVLAISLVLTRMAALALTYTGLSRQAAKFQARSAFTGVGFTTTESETVVNHPVRRRILLIMMLVGNAGIVTAVSTLVIGFVDVGTTDFAVRVIVLVIGLAILISLALSGWVEHMLSRLVYWALKRYTDMDVKDYASLLQLAGDYVISELFVEDDDWIAGRSLTEMKLNDEGVLVLGIHKKDGTFEGTPRGETVVDPRATLILYGRAANIKRLDKRRKGFSGQIDHAEAVSEHKAESDRPPEESEGAK